MKKKASLRIKYCTQCRWMMRAAWTAQELLTTFEAEIKAITLEPGIGGVFDIFVGKTKIWSRKSAGRFAELKELKQLVRDRIAPQKNLGHSDKKTSH